MLPHVVVLKVIVVLKVDVAEGTNVASTGVILVVLQRRVNEHLVTTDAKRALLLSVLPQFELSVEDLLKRSSKREHDERPKLLANLP